MCYNNGKTTCVFSRYSCFDSDCQFMTMRRRVCGRSDAM